MDVKIWWNTILELLDRAYRLWRFACKWLKNPKFIAYQPLFTTHDESTIVKYVMDVLRPFRYWTWQMSKSHTFTLHHAITVYNDMSDHMDGVTLVFAKKMTQLKEDLNFAVKFGRQSLSKYYSEVTPITSLHLISVHIIDPFRTLQLFRKWDNGMDINLDDETLYTIQYQELFLIYVENIYCAKHQGLFVNKPKRVACNDLSPPQWLLDLVNLGLIRMICPAMVMNA
jgi:hypothetical protein